MQTVILAGGQGSRLSEETTLIPKPLVRIGHKPILWHLMKIYSHYNFNDFIICGGYKFELIKQYFLNYYNNNVDITVNLKTKGVQQLDNHIDVNWSVSLIDTGVETLTGGRLFRIKDHIQDDLFMVNYADGLSDININSLISFHRSHGKIATLTAVQKEGKFGTIQLDDHKVTSFIEKPVDEDYINGGFFVFNKKVFDFLDEIDLPVTLDLLAKEGELMAYKHLGNWSCMDSLNDKQNLEDLWNKGDAFWKL